MANDTKYRRNRNNWRRVYPLRRTKPTSVVVYDNGVEDSIDTSRYIRSRSFFSLDKPVLGTAPVTGSGEGEESSGSLSAFLPTCPDGFTYDATVSSSVSTQDLFGTITVGTWSEISGGIDLAVEPFTNGPTYDGSTWINFNYESPTKLPLDSGTNEWDFLKEDGGSMVAVWRTTASLSDTEGNVYVARDAVMGDGIGTESTIVVTGSNINFSIIAGVSGSVTESVSPTVTNDSGVHVIVGRWVSGSVDGISFSDGLDIRIDGDWTGNSTSWTDWNGTNSGFNPRVAGSGFPQGPGPFEPILPGELSLLMICPDVFTDATCGAIERWAQQVYGVQLTSSIDGVAAPTS